MPGPLNTLPAKDQVDLRVFFTGRENFTVKGWNKEHSQLRTKQQNTFHKIT